MKALCSGMQRLRSRFVTVSSGPLSHAGAAAQTMVPRVSAPPRTLLQPPSVTAVRSFAFITGHKKTKKKNKKKRSAILRKDMKKSAAKHNALKEQRGKLDDDDGDRYHRPRFYETPTPPDYPLGPNYTPPVETEPETIPHLLLATTASPFVYISKPIVEANNIDASLLYSGSGSLSELLLGGRFQAFDRPTEDANIVGFLGRSNVGKSSLLNALMQQTGLAVTSKQPGRTQKAYYYGWVPNDEIRRAQTKKKSSQQPYMPDDYVMDLPGYGYAVGPDKAVNQWQDDTQTVLLHHRDEGTLRRVFLLQDARLGIPQPIDTVVASWLAEAEIPFTVVLTKADSDEPALAIKHANLLGIRFHQLKTEALEGDQPSRVYMSPVVHVTSAKKKTGLVEMWTSIHQEFGASSDHDDDEYDEDYDDDNADEEDEDTDNEESHDNDEEESYSDNREPR
jgi:GTP-binding protein